MPGSSSACRGAVPSNSMLWSPANSGPLATRNQVLTLHDLSPLEHPEWFRPAYAAWYGLFLPVLVRRVKRIITPSEYVRQGDIVPFPFARRQGGRRARRRGYLPVPPGCSARRPGALHPFRGNARTAEEFGHPVDGLETDRKIPHGCFPGRGRRGRGGSSVPSGWRRISPG